MCQRNVSANTIASYRDTFRLLFTFGQARLHKPPSALALDDLDVPFISAFLADLETTRGAGVRTRNLRLTAQSAQQPLAFVPDLLRGGECRKGRPIRAQLLPCSLEVERRYGSRWKLRF